LQANVSASRAEADGKRGGEAGTASWVEATVPGRAESDSASSSVDSADASELTKQPAQTKPPVMKVAAAAAATTTKRGPGLGGGSFVGAPQSPVADSLSRLPAHRTPRDSSKKKSRAKA
jgi:hypothetical protein